MALERDALEVLLLVLGDELDSDCGTLPGTSRP